MFSLLPFLIFLTWVTPGKNKKRNKKTAKRTGAYRAENKNEEGISPQAPEAYKTSIWTKILKQEIKCHWHQKCISIDCTCSQIQIADIKAPGCTAVILFLCQVSGTVSKGSNHKYQCSRDPDKTISKKSENNSISMNPIYLEMKLQGSNDEML